MYAFAHPSPVRRAAVDDERLTLSPALAQLASELEERALPGSADSPRLAPDQSRDNKRVECNEREAAH
jgi:hypothetical protein